jgi:adenylate cyclase
MMALLGRVHGIVAAAVHAHQGMLDAIAPGGTLAVFGAPVDVENPCRSAAAAVEEMLRGVSRLDAERARQGKPEVGFVIAATFGEAVAGTMASSGPLAYAVTGVAAEEAVRLRGEAARSGSSFVATDAFRARAGDALSDFQHPGCD